MPSIGVYKCKNPLEKEITLFRRLRNETDLKYSKLSMMIRKPERNVKNK
jgi:hypothetical protein